MPDNGREQTVAEGWKAVLGGEPPREGGQRRKSDEDKQPNEIASLRLIGTVLVSSAVVFLDGPRRCRLVFPND